MNHRLHIAYLYMYQSFNNETFICLYLSFRSDVTIIHMARDIGGCHRLADSGILCHQTRHLVQVDTREDRTGSEKRADVAGRGAMWGSGHRWQYMDVR